MKIAYVTMFDPHDRSKWSGSIFHIAQSLIAAGCEVEFIGPLHERFRVPFAAMNVLTSKLLKKVLQRDREPVVIEHYARQVDAAVDRIQPDVVFSPGAITVCRARTRTPIVTWADATYASGLEYRWELPPTARSKRLGLDMDRRIAQRAALSIFCSDWAAKSAIDDAGTDPSRVRVVPFGANMETTPSPEQAQQAIAARPGDVCRLLYVGTGWERKGGDVAIATAKQLIDMGKKVELTMVGGDVPDQSQLPPFARKQSFIRNDTAEGRAELAALFSKSHFIIHPARAEAYGLVLCEANAYGVPCLTTRVGGIPTIVKEGVNGILAAPEDPTTLAAAARKLLDDPNAYRALCTASYARFREALNWDVAGKTVKGYLEELLRTR